LSAHRSCGTFGISGGCTARHTLTELALVVPCVWCGRYFYKGTTADGRPFYREESNGDDLVLFYDSACGGDDDDDGADYDWTVSHLHEWESIDTKATSDLDGDGRCAGLAWLPSHRTHEPPDKAYWQVNCGNKWATAELEIFSSAATCKGKGKVLRVDSCKGRGGSSAETKVTCIDPSATTTPTTTSVTATTTTRCGGRGVVDSRNDKCSCSPGNAGEQCEYVRFHHHFPPSSPPPPRACPQVLGCRCRCALAHPKGFLGGAPTHAWHHLIHVCVCVRVNACGPTADTGACALLRLRRRITTVSRRRPTAARIPLASASPTRRSTTSAPSTSATQRRLASNWPTSRPASQP